VRPRALLLAALLLASLPATAGAKQFPVTSTGDIGAGSLREAIKAANANPESDTIPISATGTIELETALPDVSGDVEIQGPGADQLTVRRKSGSFGIFSIANNVVASISGLAVTNGRSGFGAGIASLGPLTLDDVKVSGNEAVASGGTIAVAQGGGISASGPLTIIRSTVSGNTASATAGTSITVAKGGGILGGSGPLVIDQSTVSGNTATAKSAGGVVVAQAGGVFSIEGLDLTRSTVSGNVTAAEASGTAVSRGGGIDASEGLTISSSTVTANTAKSSDIESSANINAFGTNTISNTIVSEPLGGTTSCFAPLTSGGFNIEDGTSCGLSLPTDLPSTDPGIDPSLGANGGSTLTHALLPGSPAIDRGNGLGEGIDQRGLPRPSDFAEVPNVAGGDGSDIGAFELQAPAPVARDLTAPQTTIDKAPPRRTRKRLARFRFSSNEAGSRFECKLDRRRFAPCTSPFKRRVKRVKHTFSVRAIDAAGNIDPTPAQRRWRVLRRKRIESGRH
jgi:hypothetical protein